MPSWLTINSLGWAVSQRIRRRKGKIYIEAMHVSCVILATFIGTTSYNNNTAELVGC